MPVTSINQETYFQPPTICELPKGTLEGRTTLDITNSLQSLKNKLNLKQGLLITAYLVTLAVGVTVLTLGLLAHAHSVPIVLAAIPILFSSNMILTGTLRNTYQRMILNKRMKEPDFKNFLENKEILLRQENLLQVNDIYKQHQAFKNLLNLIRNPREEEPSEDTATFMQDHQIPAALENQQVILHLLRLEECINQRVAALAQYQT